MIRLLALTLIQCITLVAGQVFLKFALARMLPFSLSSMPFWSSVLLNWQFAMTGISYGVATVLWMYMMKRYEFSVIYPLISLSYVFGMIAAMIFFHETIPLTRWIGILLILLGSVLIVK